MPTYRYELQQIGGDLMAGQLAAESAAAAADALRDRGGRIVRLVPFHADERRLLRRIWKVLNAGTGPTKREVLDFTTQLAVMVRAGISLRVALEGIASNTASAALRETLCSIKEDVEAGCTFSDAISQYPKLFTPLYVNMVRASELSGSFGHMLDRIAKIISRQIETKKMMIGASIYPAVIGGLATCVTIFLLTFVLPRFAGVFAGKEEVLPWPTTFLMGLSEWMVVYWWTVPTCMCAAVLGIIFGGRTEQGSKVIDTLKLRFPIIRNMLRALYINRSLQTLGELLNAGVPVLSSLEVTGDISGNRHYKCLWYEVRQGAREGNRIAETLGSTTLLPKPVIQMIGAGEESGQLGNVLQEVAEYYDMVLRDAVRTFTSLLEPAMIVFMGGIVGFIAMAIILPIFKMSAVVSG